MGANPPSTRPKRNEIARQFHDTVCQSLTAISVTLDVFQRRAGRGQPISAKDLQELRTLLDRAHRDAAQLLEKLESESPETSSPPEKLK